MAEELSIKLEEPGLKAQINDEIPYPDVSQLITEDDKPVDNILSERNMRLLTESLHASWKGPKGNRPFVALANVALFYTPHDDPLVPDVLVSLDVTPPSAGGLQEKRYRSYFIWEYGKRPDIVIEIVSNSTGREDSYKLRQYGWIGIDYYIIFDPYQYLSDQILRVYERHGIDYQLLARPWLSEPELGLILWTGNYAEFEATWLRWCDKDGNMILTGAESAAIAENRAEQAENRAEQAENRAEQAENRAEQAENRAEQAENRAERLLAQLRALGIEPESL